MKKLIFVVLIAAVVAPMFIKGPDGTPIMAISDWLPSEDSLLLPAESTEQTFYRYQDADGNWQYTDTPPEGESVETVEVDTSGNRMDAIEIQQRPAARASEPAAGVAGYVENMQNVMQDAENVQQLMDDRASQLEEQLRASQ